MKKDESTYPQIRRFISIVEGYYQALLRKRKMVLGAVSVCVILTGLLIGGILESIFYLSPGVKISAHMLILLLSTATALSLFRKLPSPSYRQFYHQFGKRHSLPQLSDALDLYYDASESPLHRAAIRQNLESLETEALNKQLKDFIGSHPVHRYYRSWASGLAGSFLLLMVFASWQPSAMNRLARFWNGYTPPNPYSYTVEPGSVTVEQGESISPRINFENNIPEKVTFAFKTEVEDQFRQRNAGEITNQQARFSPVSLTTNGTYYFIMDGFKSKRYEITVQLRPRLEQLTLEVIPPRYTGLDTTSYTYPFSQIQAYRGSKIRLAATTNKAVKELLLYRTGTADSTGYPLSETDSLTYRHEWEISRTDTVSFSMTDKAGLSNKNKFRFVVDPRKDQVPFVNLMEPAKSLQMKNPENLDLLYEAGDDFGLTSATLHYELNQAFSDEIQKGSVSLGRPAMNREQTHTWDLPALNPKPRDVVTYWVEVTDNDAYSGYKVGRSRKRTITFPSMTEYMDELDSKENEVTKSIEKVSDSFQKMEREYRQFKESLKKNPETNWNQKEQLQQVEEERKEVDKQVEELNKKFEKIRKEIEKNQAMSPETLKAYEELQKLMKEIDSPELQKALEKLQNSLGKMNPQQMRKALENYEFNEKRYKERINRTKELFKTLKLNSNLDKMARSLEKLAGQEQKISESGQSPAEDLERQKAVRQDFEELRDKIKKLGENAPEKARDRIRKLKNEANQQMDQTQQKLNENIKRLQNQKESPKSDSETRRQQQQIQQQMQQMAQMMSSAKQQMNRQRHQINARALEYILYSLINLSTYQEELTKETEQLPPRSKAFVEKARREQNIAGQFTMLSDSLFQLSSEIPGFSNRINKKKAEVEQKLSRAVEMLSERSRSNATAAQRQSLGGINELTSMIASLLEQMQNQQQGGGSGSGMTMQQMIEQIKKMSGQQQKLNKQIQDMINDIQGDRLSRDQMDRLNQLSRQQNRIRKQLKKLQESGDLESGDRILSELERMSEQMEEAINDMRGGQLNQQLMQRQQNILSRMLSARKAAQERGKEDRREATTAEEQRNTTPPDVTLEELQQRIRKMLNDPSHTKYSEDYQRLIEQYFELLKEKRVMSNE